MEKTTLQVEQMPVSELVPYANNVRTHTERQVGEIAASIEQFGFNDPVGVWENPEGELEIVEGHGRVMAAEQLGLEDVPVIRLDHLTDDERRAYAIVHNQATDNSEWDFSVLDAELGSLDFKWGDLGVQTLDFDMDSIFSADEKPESAGSETEDENNTVTCPHCGQEFAI